MWDWAKECHTLEQVLFDGLPVPPQERAVVADADDADDGVAVAADTGLSDGRGALRVAEDVEAALIGVRSADVPNVRIAKLEATRNGSNFKRTFQTWSSWSLLKF